MIFDELYGLSLHKLDRYIASQVTEKQKLNAKWVKDHVEMNERHYKWRFDKGEELGVCDKCGNITEANKRPGRTDDKGELRCTHCDFWEKKASSKDKTRLVIDGDTYVDGGRRPAGTKFLGFGGSLFTIRQGDKVWQTNNLWHGGTVPQEFRDRLPDNAEFVDEKKFQVQAL